MTMCPNGFVPMHFACYQGDSEVIRMLYKYGADLIAKNKLGLSPMHVAAQADRAFPLTFLWYNGVDVDCVDSEGQTPLHWACYQGASEAIYYLLAWSNSLNKQDNKGKTPLHQAVEQIQKYHHWRPLKEMLIKGASREIKDKIGRKPVDMIDQSMSPQQKQDLEMILGK